MGLSNFTDPAILAAKLPTPQYRYTIKELKLLKESPLSNVSPDYLNVNSENIAGIWDLELWQHNRKTAETPVENGNRNSEPDNHRRRSGDPRERIRKEGDGIVLSPQRRSFNSGCFVPVREPQRPARAHSPLGKNEPAHIGNSFSPSVLHLVSPCI